MSEPKNQMEALIRSIKARGKVYFSHTEIDNKALDDVQTVFDAEVKELEDENRRLRSAVEKHFKANCTLDNYPNYNQDDVDLWLAFGMGMDKE